MRKSKSITGLKNVYRVLAPNLYIRLDIDPSEKSSLDDKFRLYSTNPSCSYNSVLTTKDDGQEGDDYIDLLYKNLIIDLNYTLEVDPGEEGEVYNIFEDVPFAELAELSSNVISTEEKVSEDSSELDPDEPEENSTSISDEETGNDVKYDEEQDIDSQYEENEISDEESEFEENEESKDIADGVICPFGEDD